MPPRPLALVVAGLTASAAAGCFPYHETYRPTLVGTVVDRDQRPVAGATVVTCSASRWSGFAGCPRRSETTTDGQGRFTLTPLVEVEWCCLGEAPLPETIITACAQDETGRALRAPPAAPIRGKGDGTDQRLELALPQAPYPAGCTPEPRR